MGADPDGDRGLRHLAPTYICRDTRDLRSDGHRGLAIILSLLLTLSSAFSQGRWRRVPPFCIDASLY